MLSLAAPWWLLALPLPWLLWQIRQRQSNATSATASALTHPQIELLSQLSQQQARQTLPWFWLLGCALLISALSRPQWALTDAQQGRNFILAIDISSSMKARDFIVDGQAVTRIEAVKQVAHNFIEQRQGDRIGLIVFADDAYTLVPVGNDPQLAQELLQDISHGIVGAKTAIGQAVALGSKRLQQLDPASRNLILLTDGSNTSGDIHPLNALAMAKRHGIKIYTIGVGRSDGPVMFERGPVAKATMEEVPIDEALLQKLASETEARYFRARATDQLDQVMTEIEQLETVALDDMASPPRELYLWPLLVGLGLLAFGHWRQQRQVLP